MWIHEIRALSDAEWFALFRALVPRGCFEAFGIDPETFEDPEGRLRLRVLYRDHGRILNVRITAPGEHDVDPIYSIFLQEFGQDGLDVIGLNINDPGSKRFQVDLDEYGRIPADLLSGRRNVPEEIEAMRAGLAPGQVRRGLRWVGDALEGIEAFCTMTGRRWIYCEAMAYHNAMIFERHGFAYQFKTWEDEMRWIDAEFRPPRGLFFRRLDGSTPFRQPGMEATVRGRSWAIHDGIMGKPWNRPMMVKEVGVHSQVNTFEGGRY
jgi:hypothetical protein